MYILHLIYDLNHQSCYCHCVLLRCVLCCLSVTASNDPVQKYLHQLLDDASKYNLTISTTQGGRGGVNPGHKRKRIKYKK
jgi:hypothetical protein